MCLTQELGHNIADNYWTCKKFTQTQKRQIHRKEIRQGLPNIKKKCHFWLRKNWPVDHWTVGRVS